MDLKSILPVPKVKSHIRLHIQKVNIAGHEFLIMCKNRFTQDFSLFLGPNIIKITPLNSGSVEIEGDLVMPEHIGVRYYAYFVEKNGPGCRTTNSKRKCIINGLRPSSFYEICAYGQDYDYSWHSGDTSCMTIITPVISKFKHFNKCNKTNNNYIKSNLLRS